MSNTYQIRSYDPDLPDFTVKAGSYASAAKLAALTMYGTPTSKPTDGAERAIRRSGGDARPGHFIAEGRNGTIGRQFYVSLAVPIDPDAAELLGH